jgi:hypothetical protein
MGAELGLLLKKLRLNESEVLRMAFGPKIAEGTGVHNNELATCTLHPVSLRVLRDIHVIHTRKNT